MVTNKNSKIAVKIIIFLFVSLENPIDFFMPLPLLYSRIASGIFKSCHKLKKSQTDKIELCRERGKISCHNMPTRGPFCCLDYVWCCSAINYNCIDIIPQRVHCIPQFSYWD